MVTFTASAQVAFGVHGNLVNFKVSDELKQIAGLPQGNPETVALEDVYGMGYGGGLHLDFSLGILSLRVSGDYVTLTPDNAKFQTFLAQYVGASSTAFTVDGGRIEIMGGNANLKFVVLPLPVVKPYITGGIGISQVKAQETKVTYTPPAPLITDHHECDVDREADTLDPERRGGRGPGLRWIEPLCGSQGHRLLPGRGNEHLPPHQQSRFDVLVYAIHPPSDQTI